MAGRRITEVIAEGTLFAIRYDDGSCEFYNRTGETVRRNGIAYSGMHTRETAQHIPAMCPVWLRRLNEEKKLWRRITAFLRRLLNRAKAKF